MALEGGRGITGSEEDASDRAVLRGELHSGVYIGLWGRPRERLQNMSIVTQTEELEIKAKKKAYLAAWWLKNSDRAKKVAAVWRDANREYMRAFGRERYAADVEAIRIKRNARRKTEQGDAIRARERAYRLANIEREKARHRKWDKEHPEARRKYMKANPDKIRSQWQARRARKRAAPGRWTAADIRVLHSKQGGLCAYYQDPYGKSFDVDHVIPLSRGGTNWPDNIVLSCRPCNRAKGDKLIGFHPLAAVGE